MRRTLRKKLSKKGRKAFRKHKRTTKKTTKRLRKVIQREIHRAAEDKFVYTTYSNWLIETGGSAAIDGSVLTVSPGYSAAFSPTPNGTNRSGRIGQRITSRRLVTRGSLIAANEGTQNLSPCPTLMDVYFFYDKQNPLSTPTPATNGDFFYSRNNTSATETFSYNILDHFKLVNDARYRVLMKRTYKLGFQNYAQAGTTPTNQDYANNDFRYFTEVKWGLTKHFAKNVTFPDMTRTIPEQHGIWVLFVPMRVDGNTANNGDIFVLGNFSLKYMWEDM